MDISTRPLGHQNESILRRGPRKTENVTITFSFFLWLASLLWLWLSPPPPLCPTFFFILTCPLCLWAHAFGVINTESKGIPAVISLKKKMHLFQGFLNLLFLVLQAPILVQCVLNFSVFPTQPSRVELDKGAFLTTTPLPAAESDGAQPKQGEVRWVWEYGSIDLVILLPWVVSLIPEAAETPTGPDTDPKSKEVVYAQVEGCYNCKMLRLPEVKKFVDNDLPK